MIKINSRTQDIKQNNLRNKKEASNENNADQTETKI